MLIMSEYYIRKTESLIFILEKLSTKTKFPMKFSDKSFPNIKKKKNWELHQHVENASWQV